MNKELMEKLLDIDMLSEAFTRGDIEWHKEEWKLFIGLIRADTISKIKLRMPKNKKRLVDDLEVEATQNELINSYNKALDEVNKILDETNRI